MSARETLLRYIREGLSDNASEESLRQATTLLKEARDLIYEAIDRLSKFLDLFDDQRVRNWIARLDYIAEQVDMLRMKYEERWHKKALARELAQELEFK